MQKFIALLGFVLITGNATNSFSQQAQETTVKFEKSNVSGVVAEYNHPESVMSDAIKVQLDREGLGKSDKNKGFMSYAGVTWQRLGTDKLDIYFKVDGNKSKSTITILVSKGYNNFVNSTSEAAIINKVKEFLNNLEGTALNVQYALDLKAQEDIIKSTEKNYNNALSDSTDLAKDKQKLENKIIQQTGTLQSKRQALEEQRKKLAGMKKEGKE